MTKSIILTGSTGFIGLNVLSQMKSTYSFLTLSRKGGYDLSKNDFTTHIPKGDYDTIIHLAQSAHFRDFPNQAADIFNVNSYSTFNLLEWARLNGVKRFILASTGSVYPNNKEILNEERTTPAASNFYGTTKIIAEELAAKYSPFFETISLRIFTCYGPGQQAMLMPGLIQKVISGQEITLANEIGMRFNPIYINDFVRCLNVILQKPFKNAHTVLNVAGPEVVTIKDVVDIIECELQKKAVLRFTSDNHLSLVADIEKLGQLIDINSFKHVRDGIKATINAI